MKVKREKEKEMKKNGRSAVKLGHKMKTIETKNMTSERKKIKQVK